MLYKKHRQYVSKYIPSVRLFLIVLQRVPIAVVTFKSVGSRYALLRQRYAPPTSSIYSAILRFISISHSLQVSGAYILQHRFSANSYPLISKYISFSSYSLSCSIHLSTSRTNLAISRRLFSNVSLSGAMLLAIFR